MADKIGGFLEVGCNDKGEIIINHPDLKSDGNEVGGHIVFSPDQARALARILTRYADQIEREARIKADDERNKAAHVLPVDRSARVLTDGSPVTDDHRELLPSGQQKGYVVLTAEERAKGFVRPVRRSYRHVGRLETVVNDGDYGNDKDTQHRVGGCGSVTTMALSLAETYARDPSFYFGTFCAMCCQHFPLDQFVWEGTMEQVGQ
jgi:hypothetical protein